MERTRSVRLVAAVIAAVACVQVGGGVQTARADASGNASCIGIEASTISPPGTSSEFPGGVPDLISAVKALAGQLGVPPGAFVSIVARIHAGSHEACDRASG
jgi:hypothetical protein